MILDGGTEAADFLIAANHERRTIGMPLTLNVAISKKQGLPDYGSIGATCGLNVEVDGSLLDHDPEGLQRQIQNAYVACAQAVNDQLARQQGNGAPASTENGHTRSNGNGHAATSSNGNGHRASEKQLGYARQLAGQIRGLGVRRVETICQTMFGKPLADLATVDASGLIDTLKEIKAGSISVDDALSGAAS
jgi:hypothetical protein